MLDRLFVLYMFHHVGGMVGPSKTLKDLRKVEASVRVTCRACKAVKTYDLEELIDNRRYQRRSMEWVAVQHDLPCSNCQSTDVHVAGMPFGKNDKEMRRQRATGLLVNLALTILAEAAPRNSFTDANRAAVRLALRVLYPHVGDRELLETYWRSVSEETDKIWSGGHQALRWIVTALVARGYAVWAEFR